VGKSRKEDGPTWSPLYSSSIQRLARRLEACRETQLIPDFHSLERIGGEHLLLSYQGKLRRTRKRVKKKKELGSPRNLLPPPQNTPFLFSPAAALTRVGKKGAKTGGREGRWGRGITRGRTPGEQGCISKERDYNLRHGT